MVKSNNNEEKMTQNLNPTDGRINDVIGKHNDLVVLVGKFRRSFEQKRDHNISSSLIITFHSDNGKALIKKGTEQ